MAKLRLRMKPHFRKLPTPNRAIAKHLVFANYDKVLHVYQLGNPTGPPLVLIHGLSGSRFWWRKNLSALRKDYALYVLELPGYGSGNRQASTSILENVLLIERWLNCQTWRSFSLLGHSMGGQICLHLAARFQERVHKLVLADSSGLLNERIFKVALRLPRASLQSRLSFVPRLLWDGVRSGLPNLWRSGSYLLKDSLDNILPQISTSTLIIWGKDDFLVPRELGLELSRQLPHARYLELEGGHVVMVDAYKQFNEAVLEFLQV